MIAHSISSAQILGLFFLAIITLLAILFFLSATSVQAGLPMSKPAAPIAKDTMTLPSTHNTTQSQQIWYGDITDISNERSGNASSVSDQGTVKDAVQNSSKSNFMGRFLDVFRSFIVGGPAESMPGSSNPIHR